VFSFLERAGLLGGDCMEFIKFKNPRNIPRQCVLPNNVVDVAVSLRVVVIHISVECVVNRRWCCKLDAVLWGWRLQRDRHRRYGW
jgi:hypothetical protein